MGAEAVSPAVLRQFSEAFGGGRHGLDPDALSPGYGMAEHTVYATSGVALRGSKAPMLAACRASLDAGDGAARYVEGDDLELVSVGSASPGFGVSIKSVDPATAAPRHRARGPHASAPVVGRERASP